MENKAKDKMTGSEKLTIIKRSLKLINTADKGHTLRGIAEQIPEIISNFLGFYMAAYVIDGIVLGMSFKALLLRAGIICSIDLALWITLRQISRRRATHDFILQENRKRILWNKVMDMDYTRIEDSQTHNHFARAQNYIQNSNSGIPHLERNLIFSIYGILQIVIGIIIISQIAFKSPSVTTGFTGFVQSPWGLISMFSVVMLLEIYKGVYINGKSIELIGKTESNEEVLTSQRVENYYTNHVIWEYQNGKEIRIYNEGEMILNEVGKTIDKRLDCYKNFFKKDLKNDFFFQMINIVTQVLMFGLAVYRAMTGMLTSGEVVAFALYFSQIQAGISNLSDGLGAVKVTVPFCKCVFDFLDIPNVKYMGSIPTEKRDDNEYEFEFKHVFFKYPNSEDYVLKDINLKWKIGEKMALVGKNGCGKSTLIKLLCRLYDCTDGEILLNGIDIRKYRYEDYMALFSVVFQDSKLFSFSIAENVAANTEYDSQRVTDCVVRSGFGERLEAMDNGIETYLYKDFDDNGVEISGGEAQKLCLARAIYKGSPFIVLDEPTAALDPISEYEIYTKFNSIVGTRTAIYISHRLSSCRFCDDITVLDNGRIVERGSHDKLINESGVYSQLWSAQAQYYKDTAGELFA